MRGQIQSQRQSQKQSGGIAAAVANVGMTTTTMGDVKAVRWTTAADSALRQSGVRRPARCSLGSRRGVVTVL
jgi:hypothetical protein